MSRYLDIVTIEQRDSLRASVIRWGLGALLILTLLFALFVWRVLVVNDSKDRLVIQQERYDRALDSFRSLNRSIGVRRVSLFDEPIPQDIFQSRTALHLSSDSKDNLSDSCFSNISEIDLALVAAIESVLSAQRRLSDMRHQRRALFHRADLIDADTTALATKYRKRVKSGEKSGFFTSMRWHKNMQGGEFNLITERAYLEQLQYNRLLREAIVSFDTMTEQSRNTRAEIDKSRVELEKYLLKNQVRKSQNQQCMSKNNLLLSDFNTSQGEWFDNTRAILDAIDENVRGIEANKAAMDNNVKSIEANKVAIDDNASGIKKLKKRLITHETPGRHGLVQSRFILVAKISAFTECLGLIDAKQRDLIDHIAGDVLLKLDLNQAIAVLRFEGGYDEQPADNCTDSPYNELIAYSRARNLAKTFVDAIKIRIKDRQFASGRNPLDLIHIDAYHLRLPQCRSRGADSEICSDDDHRRDRRASVYVKYLDSDLVPDPFLDSLRNFDTDFDLTSRKPRTVNSGSNGE